MVLQQLTRTRGLPKHPQVVQDIIFCGLGCGLKNFPKPSKTEAQNVRLREPSFDFSNKHFEEGNDCRFSELDRFADSQSHDRLQHLHRGSQWRRRFSFIRHSESRSPRQAFPRATKGQAPERNLKNKRQQQPQ
jgi:hypothetical protein